MSDYSKSAVIDSNTNIVVNTIMADARYDIPPGGCYLVDISDIVVGIGYSYDPVTQEFTPPPED